MLAETWSPSINSIGRSAAITPLTVISMSAEMSSV